VHTAWTRDGQPQLFALDIVASEATLALSLGPDAYRLRGRSRGADVATERGGPMDRSIARFLEAVRSGDPALVPCRPADARATLAVALACEQALASGRGVPVAG
jgi:predicted dehydrogenase